MSAIQVLEYLDVHGRSPYAAWFEDLNASAAAKVAAALYRLEAGNFSNVKGVGEGVLERRIDFGPGYRIYFGKDGETEWFCSAAAASSASATRSQQRKNGGQTTSGARQGAS